MSPKREDDSTVRGDPLRHDLRLPAGKKICLHVVGGPEKGKTYVCDRARVVIGRRNVELALNDPQVSQPHCVLEIADERIRLRDLDSTNGTYVGDRRVRELPLEHLSEFRVGAHSIVLMVTRADF